VPVIIPKDTFEAMRLLNDNTVREAANVHSSNEFMFPSTRSSSVHISGWHAVNRVCVSAKVDHPDRLTATKMRHRLSTLYAGLDVSENERQLFYRHMGHSGDINASIYQTPLAEAEILTVGSRLQKLDGHLGGKADANQSTVTQNEDDDDETGTTIMEARPTSCDNTRLINESSAPQIVAVAVAVGNIAESQDSPLASDVVRQLRNAELPDDATLSLPKGFLLELLESGMCIEFHYMQHIIVAQMWCLLNF